jgi:hypothetical protein
MQTSKKLLCLVLLSTLATGCSTTPYKLETGEEVAPPYGCKELRKSNPEADC